MKILLKKGYYIRNQKGSHVHLRHSFLLPVTVPNHKVIALGTLKAIMKTTGLTEKDFE
ncbi:MAG: type II toxin-antitoxin system HicA family toxin [Candidatus Diapherotrites archaeon]|nr:type II toxin-antitoxin system HicA family toxin [Candidatus Diapherotrites archaeon]